ncbi:hypothetical protein DENSPDRAFT_879422 [Dentipellis sp. KUC8613]|nr:hypothetical protein DENSPDRAFT_879422 [Dentipellis sp. KUC8613]
MTRDDYELRLLANGGFNKNGKSDEFYGFVRKVSHEASLDEQYNVDLMAERRAQAKARSDGPSYIAGTKPFPGQKTVKFHPIPNSPLSPRLRPTGDTAYNIWVIDFAHSETGDVVVTPPNFELSIVPDLTAPWLPCSGMEMRPIWHAWGTMPGSITPAMETYLAPARGVVSGFASGPAGRIIQAPGY